MRTIQLLEDEDLIHPEDWIRPLGIFGEDFQIMSAYSGAPLDHFLWAPVWLELGEIWWGHTYGHYEQDVGEMTGRQIEAIRGCLPQSNRLDLSCHNWEKRHPTWWEDVYMPRRKSALVREVAFGKWREGRKKPLGGYMLAIPNTLSGWPACPPCRPALECRTPLTHDSYSKERRTRTSTSPITRRSGVLAITPRRSSRKIPWWHDSSQ